jgi:hypothetical protein
MRSCTWTLHGIQVELEDGSSTHPPNMLSAEHHVEYINHDPVNSTEPIANPVLLLARVLTVPSRSQSTGSPYHGTINPVLLYCCVFSPP